ncbi:MAG: hypothetical protein MRJ68_11320 [Nitrospira sp.]|nr:hypothetical protein [Nitrospira sp.]
MNGMLTPVHVLEEFAGTLIDIHGQHDQQSLLSSTAQLEVLMPSGRYVNYAERIEPFTRDDPFPSSAHGTRDGH